jgi:hypothetical protein
LKKHLSVLLTTVGAALAILAMAVPAAQATPPAAPYQDFAGCPSYAEDDTVAICMKMVFDGGHLQLGKKNIPVTNPFTLRGGLRQVSFAYLANSEGGLSSAKQTVEGGLIGLTGLGWLDQVLSEKEQLKVYATVELAGEPGPLAEDPFTLPIKVHLENPVLGNTCYVGSNESPIQLSLITGTTNPPPPNKPITGNFGTEFAPEPGRPEVIQSLDSNYVDNSFAVPGATGCQLNLGSLHIGINGLVNATAGLPAAAGTNEAVLANDFFFTSPGVIYP